MARHFRIDDILPDAQHAEFTAFVLRRGTTIDDAWGWLDDHGHVLSRAAVHRWMRRVRDARVADPAGDLRQLLIERVRGMTPDELVAFHNRIKALPPLAALPPS